MAKILFVGVGGFLGAILRYLLGGWISNSAATAFPIATLVVNVTGSFALGFFMALSTERFAIDSNLRPFIAIGFIGAYTTFSTFGYETFRLAENGSFAMAFGNILVSVLAGLLAVYLGFVVGRIL